MNKTGTLTLEITLKEANLSTKEFLTEIKEILKDSYNCSVKCINRNDIIFKGKNNFSGLELVECDNCGNVDETTFDFIELGRDEEGKYEKYKCLKCNYINKFRWLDAKGNEAEIYPSEYED